MNRLTRDQLIGRGLDMVDSPSLNELDRPSGTVVAAALSIGWLQDALDLFHNRFPWAGIVKSTSVTISSGNDTLSLPSDFIMDVRGGLLITTAGKKRRLGRWPLQRFVTASLLYDTAGVPERYVVLPPNLRVWRLPDATYSGTLWYYALPTTLAAATVPNFPSDWVLVEYIRLRGLEWLQKTQPGTALNYAQDQVRALLASGLGFEPEDDVLPLDTDVYGSREVSQPWDWMGTPIVS